MISYTQLEEHLHRPDISPASQRFLAGVDAAIEQLFADGESSVEALARRLNLSESQFRRHLLAHAGVAPKRYILQARIRQSIRLMNENPLIIMSEVARQCGFFDNSHFTHTFYRLLGQLPREYVLAGNRPPQKKT